MARWEIVLADDNERTRKELEENFLQDPDFHVIGEAKAQGRKGLVLTCKDKLVHYYAKFGFVSEGVSGSTHGNVVWYQMRLRF